MGDSGPSVSGETKGYGKETRKAKNLSLPKLKSKYDEKAVSRAEVKREKLIDKYTSIYNRDNDKLKALDKSYENSVNRLKDTFKGKTSESAQRLLNNALAREKENYQKEKASLKKDIKTWKEKVNSFRRTKNADYINQQS